ncbi:MAG: rRNA maturation RNase YbeY [Campylobacterales bacterium]|jgi:probable rRNA maturation factor
MVEIFSKMEGFTPPVELLERIWSRLTDRPVEVLFVGVEEISQLNREFRGKEEPTDVLSFPTEGEFQFQPLGTVVIGVPVAEEEARARGHRLEEEIGVLFLHGLLHLLGYDHETDNGKMEELEGRLARELGLPDPLTGR